MGHSLEYEEFSEVMAEALDNEITGNLSVAVRNQFRAAMWKLWGQVDANEFAAVLDRIAGERERLNAACEKARELDFETAAS